MNDHTGLTVVGVARDTNRRLEWSTVLNSTPLPNWVHLDLQTPEDVLIGSSSPTRLIEDKEQASVEVSDSTDFQAEALIQSYLKEAKSGETSVGFANASLTATERILTQAVALKHLTDLDKRAEESNVSESDRDRIASMANDHIHTLQHLITELRQRMIPAFAPMLEEGSPEASITSTNWAERAPGIDSNARLLHRQAVMLFGSRPQENTNTPEPSGRSTLHSDVIDFSETLRLLEAETRTSARALKVLSSTRH